MSDKNKPDSPTPSTAPGEQVKPIIGMMFFGGGLSGALIRDIRLANELADRGYEVHVWWVMDAPDESPLRSSIKQYLLFNGLRYRKPNGSNLHELIGKIITRFFTEKKRQRTIQKRTELTQTLMTNLFNLVCDGIENDPVVFKRMVQQLDASGVTHMLPMLGVLCPFVEEARKKINRPIKYLVTFQGYELYVNYAQRAGCEQKLYDRLRQTAKASDFPAITVSEDYMERVINDIGIDRDSLIAIPPGVPTGEKMEDDQARKIISQQFKRFDPDLPLITFLGRQDTEKGIDLLLYAVKLLEQQGVKCQLAIAGPTLFGQHYSHVMAQLSLDLRLTNLFWGKKVSEEMRKALFSYSRCVVLPAIHREPFGMVPVEAVGCETPAVVPNYGGVINTIQANGVKAGLHFNVWDSGDLAKQIKRLIEDDALYEKLAKAGPTVADYYSIANLANRVMTHIGLPTHPEQ